MKKTIMAKIIITGYESATFSMGYQVEPEKFDHDTSSVIGRSTEVVEINKQILFTRSELIRHYNILKEDDLTVTPEMLKNSYDGNQNKIRTVLQAFDFHNEKFKLQVDKKKRANSTYKKWCISRSKLAEFIKTQFKQDDFLLSKIDYAFAEDYFSHLTLGQDLADNTAMKYVKNTKQIMELARKRKWVKVNGLEDFVCTYLNPDRDVLDIGELITLCNKHFDISRLEEAKDVYLFMDMTGYSYKDAKLLEPGNVCKHFDGEDWIIKNREKTWCRENVPLLPIAKEIIEKYKDHPYCVANGVLLPVRSNQRFNGYLKEIADCCGIKKNLTTHTARHTFATTVTLANGVPLETVSAMLGHKSIRTTQIYAKIVAQKVSTDMKLLKDKFQLSLPQSLFTAA